MGILTIMIMAKLTYLEDKEWVWFMTYSGLLLIFSIPFMVGLHKHNDQHPSRSSNMEEEDDSSSNEPKVEILSKKIGIVSKKKKQPEFGLIKETGRKKQKPYGKNPFSDSSASSSESSSENENRMDNDDFQAKVEGGKMDEDAKIGKGSDDMEVAGKKKK